MEEDTSSSLHPPPAKKQKLSHDPNVCKQSNYIWKYSLCVLQRLHVDSMSDIASHSPLVPQPSRITPTLPPFPPFPRIFENAFISPYTGLNGFPLKPIMIDPHALHSWIRMDSDDEGNDDGVDDGDNDDDSVLPDADDPENGNLHSPG